MNLRRTAGAVALATLAPLSVVAPTAAQTSTFTASITAHASDTTPAAGQTFRVRGLFMINGHPAEGHLVKIQELRMGSWHPLKGAQIRANEDGHYRLRVVLRLKGKNLLRAVGVTGDGHRNAFRRFTVTVH